MAFAYRHFRAAYVGRRGARYCRAENCERLVPCRDHAEPGAIHTHTHDCMKPPTPREGILA